MPLLFRGDLLLVPLHHLDPPFFWITRSLDLLSDVVIASPSSFAGLALMQGAALSPAFQIDNSLLWLVTFWERLEKGFLLS